MCRETVSIHAPTWGATFPICIPFLLRIGFNPRTHMGCDICFNAHPIKKRVSIHAPTWGATEVCDDNIAKMMFQSTHPHGVRRTSLLPSLLRRYVSIHAPTWGATSEKTTISLIESVSIHAPTWGATHLLIIPSVCHFQFQSTHPHGVRRPHRSSKWRAACFNPRTHMGCDFSSLYLPSIASRFQSTHPHGVRQNPTYKAQAAATFQSTHPHGVRHQKYLFYLNDASFNPRTHMGCDGRCALHQMRLLVSIHAPTWGATTGARHCPRLQKVSIHAPTWGATPTPA